MHILLLGKNGMLGQCIALLLKEHGISYNAFNRSELDVTKSDAVHSKITEVHPDVVINATGYTNVDGAESERELAFLVNARAVEYIARVCDTVGAKLFHFSTDYIFNGTQAQGYREDEKAHIGPLNVYGESKLEGERAVSRVMARGQWFIIRTSWLYGAGGKNFVNTMLSHTIGGRTEFKVVNDQHGNPTYTRDLAERVAWMLERLPQLAGGVYHATNEVSSSVPAGITWYDFAVELFKHAHELDLIVSLPKIFPCSSEEFPRPARRPPHSSLLTTKLPALRGWDAALHGYLKAWGVQGKHNE